MTAHIYVKKCLLSVAALGMLLACPACERASEASQQASDSCPVGAISGTSYRVTDGDTFKLKDAGGDIIIVRLDQIDAPEKRQPWGNRSKQLLFQMLNGKQLCVAGDKHDRYGRLIGDVHAGDVAVNREMVKAGAAWAYRQYLRDQSLLTLESDARTKKLGLWSMPEDQTIPPWEFRKAVRNHDAVLTAIPLVSQLQTVSATNAPLSCPMKPRCREMASCDEAMQWLAQCGPEGIDGDRDGIPCERLCRGRSPLAQATAGP